MFFENTEYEILTPSGWQDFRGILQKPSQQLYKVILSDGSCVRATKDHHFFVNNEKIALMNLSVGEPIDHESGHVTIDGIFLDEYEEVYDIVEVGDTEHRFYINGGIVTKNCDELGFVEKRIAEEFWASINPTLSTGGKCIITSTPNNDEDTFSQIWYAANKTIDEYGNDIPNGIGINGFKAFMAKWQQHPDRDENWATAQRAKVGIEKFAREFDLEFISADSTLIDSKVLTNLVAAPFAFKTHQIRWWEQPKSGKYYLVALDPAVGNGGNDAAIQVWKLPEMVQVAEWMHDRSDAAVQIKTVIQICNYIDREIKKENPNADSEIFWTFENNACGEAIIALLKEIGWDSVPAQLLNEPTQSISKINRGLNTNGRTKSQAAAKLKSLVESNRIGIRSKPLISQLKTYVSVGNTFRGKGSEKDDLVSALLLIVRMCQMIAKWDDDTANAVRDNSLLDIDDLESFEPMPMTMAVW